METSEVMLPIDFIMKEYRPWGVGEPTTWPVYLQTLRLNGELHLTAEGAMRRGFGTVVLGPDGMVVSGQDDVVAAYVKGVRTLLCSFVFCDLI